jgi:hypothetical protein
VWLVRAEGSRASAADVAREIGREVVFEPIEASPAVLGSTVWLEPGSVKVCFSVDSRKKCVKIL